MASKLMPNSLWPSETELDFLEELDDVEFAYLIVQPVLSELLNILRA